MDEKSIPILQDVTIRQGDAVQQAEAKPPGKKIGLNASFLSPPMPPKRPDIGIRWVIPPPPTQPSIGFIENVIGCDWLANTGYDPVYGARPLKRINQRHLQNNLATMLLEGTIEDGATVTVGAGADGLEINGKAIAAEAA